jgi:mutual gliding-motility protein MglA
MVLFNHAAHQMAAKIVYYGPGLCGKTTNLSMVYQKTSLKARGEMVSLNTDTDRTLFFDLLPMDMGVVWGFKTKLQLYTVPGQVFYNSTRKLVLKGADGIVFVADSQTQMLEANRESLRNLGINLQELGVDLLEMPLVFQWNKRDLSGLLPVAVLEKELNPQHLPSFCSVASEGIGVFETLKGITRQTLVHIKTRHFTTAGTLVVESAAPAPVPPQKTQPKPALQGKLTAPKPMPLKVAVPVIAPPQPRTAPHQVVLPVLPRIMTMPPPAPIKKAPVALKAATLDTETTAV